MTGEDGLPVFSAVVDEYTDYVYSVTYRLLGNAQDAEDATQETFLKLYKTYERVNPDKSLKNWICTIAVNTARDHLRSRRREAGTVAFDEELSHGAVRNPVETVLTVEQMIESLEGNYRIAVVLFYMEDKTVKEIAEMMQRPQVVVKVWLHRARRMLLEKYGRASS